MALPEIRDLSYLLSKHFEKPVTVLDQQSKLLTAPGENYGSVMVSLTLKIEDGDKNKQDLNLVAKLIHPNETLRELFQVQVTFIKELRVYTKIVPAMAEIEQEYGIVNDRFSELFAKCYGGRSNLKESEGIVDDDSVILLENLKLLGFETGDRLKGFDYETAAFVLKYLAIFHATPIALKHLKPEIYKEVVYKTVCVPQNPSGLNSEKGKKFVEGIKNIVLVREEYKPQAERMAQDLWGKFSSTFHSATDPKDPFVSLVHSDFWVNNMMLKWDSAGLPEKLIIVDFQTPSSQTIVADLLFFIYSSVSPSVLYDRVDELIKIYYDSFVGRLEEFKLNLDDYSWNAFNAEIKRKAVGCLSQILMMYKPILLERGSIEDMNEFKEDDLLGLDGITDYCKSCMRRTFAQFVEKGWI